MQNCFFRTLSIYSIYLGSRSARMRPSILARRLSTAAAAYHRNDTLRRGRRFIDQARVLAAAGNGGNGCVSFFRDNRVARGPPEGGTGGRGGDVLVRACQQVFDLQMGTPNFRAEHGSNGGNAQRHGRNGQPLLLRVPCGTAVQRLGAPTSTQTSRMEPMRSRRELLAELLADGDEVVVARGGGGGRGNMALKSGDMQGMAISENGGSGEVSTLLLSLKLVADVGLVGLPNAGKSSLLGAISRATPEVADYPFTTLTPQLGTATVEAEQVRVADIPGLIEGAHANRGLGHSFLRHVERTSVLCYVLDLSPSAALAPHEQLRTLRRELELYQPGLPSARSRRAVIAANKADVDGAAERLAELRAHVSEMVARGELPELMPADQGGSHVTAVSARHHKNLPRLLRRLQAAVAAAKRSAERALEREPG